MKRAIGWLFFKMMGWKFDFGVPLKDIPKCVLVAAPHTANSDFFYAIFAFWYLKIPIRFFIKDSYTKPWYGFIFRGLGAIGVDRTQRSNLVDYAAGLLRERDHLYLLNTPEEPAQGLKNGKTDFIISPKKQMSQLFSAIAIIQKRWRVSVMWCNRREGQKKRC